MARRETSMGPRLRIEKPLERPPTGGYLAPDQARDHSLSRSMAHPQA